MNDEYFITPSQKLHSNVEQKLYYMETLLSFSKNFFNNLYFLKKIEICI
jgi:hypothetical protein